MEYCSRFCAVCFRWNTTALQIMKYTFHINDVLITLSSLRWRCLQFVFALNDFLCSFYIFSVIILFNYDSIYIGISVTWLIWETFLIFTIDKTNRKSHVVYNLYILREISYTLLTGKIELRLSRELDPNWVLHTFDLSNAQ